MPGPSLPARIRALVLDTRFGLVALGVAIYFVASLLTRVVLTGVQLTIARPRAGAVGLAFVVGALFDLLAAMWMVAPLVVYLTLLPERWWRGRPQRGLMWLGLVLAVGLAIFVAAAEYFFWDEFNSRFNFVAVDYLLFPYEVTTNIWESYHVAWVLAGIAIVSVLVVLSLRPRVRATLGRATTGLQRLAFFGGYAVLLALLTIGLRPALTHVSNDRAVNELAANGYYDFWEAFLGQDAPYEGLYATRPPAQVFARLQHLLSQEPAARGARFASDETSLRPVQNPGPERRLNVVVVLEESLGSEFIGALGRDTTLTPRYDSLAAEGTLLTNAYSTGNRTIRALEATTSSLPPLPGISIVRRDASVHLFTLPELLRSRGYATEFIYGGRALFDGMGKYMRNNGMENIVEQSDYPEGTYKTAWGVADEAIFDKALAEMDSLHATGKPFYTLVLSVSNHRPFTYPAGRIAADPNQKRRENAVEYADWALGRFVRQARQHAWFDSTLFVLMGDHGARVYGAQEIPLPSYQVPILFYGPKIMPAGQRIPTLASSMDIPPTVLGVLGMRYESKFFGHDLFHIDPAEGRAMMDHNNEIALMRGDRIAILGLHQSADVYRVDSVKLKMTPLRPLDDSARALIEDAIAYYDGADLLYRSGAYRFDAKRAPSAGVIAVRGGRR